VPHSHLHHRLSRVLLILALCLGLSGGAVIAASPAFAGSSLCGGSCSGKDPNTHGCIGNTDFSYTPGGQTIQLRSSANCGAWWARGIRDDCYYPVYSYIMIEQQVASPYGYYDSNDQYAQMSSNCNGGTAWTNMVDAYNSGYRERACLLDSPGGPIDPRTVSPDQWTCTDWQD
jgi:hypothetical protein